ncbi:MAG: hypothetical protein K7J46_08070 [Bryobacter sp.]|nr:hypothetical protein [Bryobacter sp. CoA8 C33]
MFFRTRDRSPFTFHGEIECIGYEAKKDGLGRPAASVLRIHQYTQTRPIFSIRGAVNVTGLSYPTVAGAVEHMQNLGILHEITGKQRDRIYAYAEYLAILSEGTGVGP